MEALDSLAVDRKEKQLNTPLTLTQYIQSWANCGRHENAIVLVKL